MVGSSWAAFSSAAWQFDLMGATWLIGAVLDAAWVKHHWCNSRCSMGVALGAASFIHNTLHSSSIYALFRQHWSSIYALLSQHCYGTPSTSQSSVRLQKPTAPANPTESPSSALAAHLGSPQLALGVRWLRSTRPLHQLQRRRRILVTLFQLYFR